MKRIAYMGFLAAAVVAVLVTAASAQRSRSARDEPLRPEARRPEPPRRDEPAPEAIVLQFEHIPAESFLETLHQLAENEHLREGLKQIPIALNGPANAVVLIAPPEVAGVMMRVAAELDLPNEFEMHMHERERAKVGLRLEMEKHKRAMDLDTMERRLKLEAMKRHLAGQPRPPDGFRPGGPPQMKPGQQGPHHGSPHGLKSPRAQPGEKGPKHGPPPMVGRWADAVEAFKTAIRLKPDSAQAYYGLGCAYLSMGRNLEAMEAFEGAVRLKPDYAEAYNNLGVACEQMGCHARAVEAYRTAMRLNPGDARVHFNLGTALLKMRRGGPGPHGGPPMMMHRAGRGPHRGPPPHAGPDERGPRREPQPRGPRGEGGPRGGENPERLFRQKMQELEGHQQRLCRELGEHVQRVHRQLEEIEHHKRQLHEAFERQMHQRQGEHERRMHEERERQMPREREPRERGEMERREHQEHERMAHREREEMERRERRERQQREYREDPDDRPRPGEGRGPGPRAPVQGRPGAGLERLLSPKVRELLRLSADQIDRIRRLLAEVHKGLEQTTNRIREAAKNIPPQERAERLRQMAERLKAVRAERMRGIHERLKEILRPEQREKIEQMRRGHRPPEPPHPPERPHPPEPRKPPQPQPPEPRGRPHRPAVQEEPAEFRLIQDVAVIGNGAVKIEVQATPGGVRALRGSAGNGRGRWTQMSEAERQAMREKSRARYLFRMLCDADIRAELDLAADQEKKIVALIERSEKERTRIEDDVRMQFGSSDAAGPDPGDPAGRERDMRQETGQAMRDAQPAFDKIMQEAVDTLTEEQKTKLDEVIRERMRLMSACGNLYLLTTASAKEQLDLTDGQSAKIKKTLLETADRNDEQRKALDEKRKAVQAANPDAGSEERRQAYRAVYEGLRKSREESIKRTRERVFKLLTAEQEPKAETLLAEADSNRRGTFGAAGTYNTIRIGGQSRAPDPPPAMTPQIVPAVYDGTAQFHLAGQDLDEPGSKPRKDGFKSPKTKPSKSQGAFADPKRTVMLLRLLQDPAVRAELDLSREQEKRVFVLQEKVRSLEERTRADVRQTLGNRMKNAATPAQRRDIKRQAAEIAREAQRATAGNMDTIVNEAAEVLTPDQHAKLETIGRDRAGTYRATGGLAILLEAKVRKKLGISDEQAERIRLILDNTSKHAKDLRAETAGGKRMHTRRRYDETVRAARERVMAVLGAEQRQMAERLLDRGPSKNGRKRDALETAPATKGYGQAA